MGVTLVTCVTLVTNIIVMLVIKCASGELLIIDLNKVWRVGVEWMGQKGALRPSADYLSYLISMLWVFRSSILGLPICG
jgi:hypothetical protein